VDQLSEVERAEAWFRRRGLPLVVRRRDRGVDLLPRATPSLVFFLLVEPILQILAYVVDRVGALWPGEGRESTGFALVVLGLTVGALVVPPLGGWLVSRSMRRLGDRGQMLVAVGVLAVTVAVLVVEQVTGLHEQPFWVSATVTASSVALLLLLTYLGAGSILAWAARVAVKQVNAVGTLASKALPLLMVVILLSFIAAEVWQLVDPRHMDRARLWGVVGFLVLLGALFLRAVVSDEMRELERQQAAGTVDELRERLAGTPLAAHVRGDVDIGAYPLSRSERFNIALVFFLAQAVQVVFFSLLVFGFFVVFGTIAVTDPLIEAWLTHPPDPAGGRLFGLSIPVPNELIHVSIFLAAFSGLYFAGAAATDPVYRDKFFDPLVADIRVSLAARAAYLARWPAERG
jgi:hypothetical protein